MLLPRAAYEYTFTMSTTSAMIDYCRRDDSVSFVINTLEWANICRARCAQCSASGTVGAAESIDCVNYVLFDAVQHSAHYVVVLNIHAHKNWHSRDSYANER